MTKTKSRILAALALTTALTAPVLIAPMFTAPAAVAAAPTVSAVQDFSDLAAKVTPAVVNVAVTMKAGAGEDGDEPRMSSDQQKQMAIIARDYLDEPVAVNDLGFVSYYAPRYVLDLGGLASYEALQAHAADPDLRVRARFARECAELPTVYAGALWAAERWLAGQPAASEAVVTAACLVAIDPFAADAVVDVVEELVVAVVDASA